MRKSIAFLIWLSCSSLAIGQLNGQTFFEEASSNIATYVDPDAYLVYSIVINSILQQPHFQQQGATIAINDQTATAMELCITPNKKHKAMLASATANYAKVNKIPRGLLPRFNLDRPYKMVQLSNDGVYLSSIGFNRGKTVAVVSAFSGSGHNYVLVKDNEGWRFADNWIDVGCVWAA